MKARKVVITLEVETDAPLKVLRDKDRWCLPSAYNLAVNQAQANVIQEAKGKKA